MKLVKCIVRPDRVVDAIEALEQVGVSGVTVTEVRGRGRRTRPTGRHRGAAYPQFLAMSMIDIVTADELVDDIVRVIIDQARTGIVGDGHIFVMPIEESHSIRTRMIG